MSSYFRNKQVPLKVTKVSWSKFSKIGKGEIRTNSSNHIKFKYGENIRLGEIIADYKDGKPRLGDLNVKKKYK